MNASWREVKPARGYLIAGWFFAVAALIGAVCFYWRSLLDETVPSRSAIPVAEMGSTSGLGAVWKVPEGMVSQRWHRSGVSVLEMGRALPLRLEEEDNVLRLGEGRFCVKGDRLWFSATDNTNPLTNGRSYEFELERPVLYPSITAWGLLALGAGWLAWAAVLAGGVPWLRAWLRGLVGMALSQDEGRARVARLAGIVFLSLGAFCVVADLGGLSRQVPIPATAMVQKAEGYFCYYLPRWIRRKNFRVTTAVLSEDRKPLARVTTDTLRLESSRGSFVSELGSVCFRGSAATSPGVTGHTYTLKLLFFPPQALLWWGMIFGTFGLAFAGQGGRRRGGQVWERPSRWASWWLPLLAVGLCKLWVVAGDEPMGQRADGWVYADSVVKMIWGDPPWLPSHPSGFPFVAGLVGQFGLPWRMGLELLYLGACSLLATSVVLIVGSRVAAFILFWLTVWYPWTLSGFRDFMSDPLVLVLVVTLLGLMIRLLGQPASGWKARNFLALGGLLFIWEWSRREDPLVYASYGLFAVLALALARAEPGRPARSRGRIAALVALPMAFVFGLAATVKWVNLQRFGVYAKCQLDGPGFTALMKALYQIKPEQILRYGPVTRQSLRAACEASPTLKSLEPALLDPAAGSTTIGEAVTGIPGEFGPTLNTLLLQTFPGGPAKADKLMSQGASEIKLALQGGRLPRRRAWYPLDPNWQLWLPDLAGSIAHRLSDGTWKWPAGEPWGTYHWPLIQHTFDQAANRRAANTYPRRLLAEGTVVAPPGSIDSVALADEQGKWLGASFAFSSNSWARGQPFDITALVDEEPAACQLVFLRQGNPQHTAQFRMEPLPYGQGGSEKVSGSAWQSAAGVALPESGQTLSYSLHAETVGPAKQTRRELVEWQLMGDYQTLVVLGLAAGLGCILLGERRHCGKQAGCCLLLAAGWFTGRAVLFGVLDANFGSYFSGATRFMRCVSPVFILILFLAGAVAAGFLRERFRAVGAGRTGETKREIR